MTDSIRLEWPNVRFEKLNDKDYDVLRKLSKGKDLWENLGILDYDDGLWEFEVTARNMAMTTDEVIQIGEFMKQLREAKP